MKALPALISLLVAVAACGFGSTSRPAAAVHGCSFELSGNLVFLGSAIPFTGNGELTLQPDPSAEWSINANSQVTGQKQEFDIIDLSSRIYTRQGPTDLWGDEPADPSTVYLGDPVPILDEFGTAETPIDEVPIDGTEAYHYKAIDNGDTYEKWVRKSDGANLRLSLRGDQEAGTVTINCVSWSSVAPLTAPAPKTRRCAANADGDVQTLGFLSAKAPGGWTSRRGDSGVEFTCGGGSRYATILAIYPADTGSTLTAAMAELRKDAGGQQLTSSGPWHFSKYSGQSFDITTKSLLKFSVGFDCLREDGSGCEAGLRLRAGAISTGSSVYDVFFMSEPDSFDAYYAAAKSILDTVTFTG